MSSPVKNSKNTESIFIFNKIEVEEKKENEETEKNDETDESEVNEDEFTCEECSTVQGLNNCELCDKENECEECYGQGGDYGPNEIWVCNTCLPTCNECEKKLYTSYDKCCGKGRSDLSDDEEDDRFVLCENCNINIDCYKDNIHILYKGEPNNISEELVLCTMCFQDMEDYLIQQEYKCDEWEEDDDD